MLNAVYEADFLGFSHGFRPGRSPHSALAALEKALMTQRVGWVLDLDIRTFFDSIAIPVSPKGTGGDRHWPPSGGGLQRRSSMRPPSSYQVTLG